MGEPGRERRGTTFLLEGPLQRPGGFACTTSSPEGRAGGEMWQQLKQKK